MVYRDWRDSAIGRDSAPRDTRVSGDCCLRDGTASYVRGNVVVGLIETWQGHVSPTVGYSSRGCLRLEGIRLGRMRIVNKPLYRCQSRECQYHIDLPSVHACNYPHLHPYKADTNNHHHSIELFYYR